MMTFPTEWKNIKCSKPPTTIGFWASQTNQAAKLGFPDSRIGRQRIDKQPLSPGEAPRRPFESSPAFAAAGP